MSKWTGLPRRRAARDAAMQRSIVSIPLRGVRCEICSGTCARSAVRIASSIAGNAASSRLRTCVA
ncbi:MAG: hypothetical protein ACK56I_17675 [bacterium]